MKKLFLFVCIIMNLTCMMLATLLFVLRGKGEAALFLGQSVDPTMAIVVLLGLAVLFVVLAAKVVTTMWKK